MIESRQNSIESSSVDWRSIAVYALLVLLGWLNLYSADYSAAHPAIYDADMRYGMQLVWIGISGALALVIMLVDGKYWHMLSYPMYLLSLLVLLSVFVFGREVNGAKAWIFIGSFGIQPSEFVKFTASLAVARYMSTYGFSMRSPVNLGVLCLLIFVPAAIIILQNDTGSALVYAAFFLVFFREGLNIWIYLAAVTLAAVFICSLIFEPFFIIAGLVLLFVMGELLANARVRHTMIFLLCLAAATALLYYSTMLLPSGLSLYTSLLIASVIGAAVALVYAYRRRLTNIYMIVVLFLGAAFFASTVDYIFDEVLQPHQSQRILITLGLESDPQNTGYNVNQSQIAIGSGGLTGKGFLQGTQTRFDFVPEQSTDFVFSTVGEEWGFIGSLIVVGLFFVLIGRLMRMGERQREPFGRIYCYCVAMIFFVHVVINIGMTIGIIPVIGIPLPFFSYGGSSFLAFTLLFFVAVKLDAGKRELMRY